jgi:hypothetical protein
MGAEGARLATAVVLSVVVLLVVVPALLIYWRGYRAFVAELAPEPEQPDPAGYRELVRWWRRLLWYLSALLVVTLAGIWGCYAAGVNVGWGFAPLFLLLWSIYFRNLVVRLKGWIGRSRRGAAEARQAEPGSVSSSGDS